MPEGERTFRYALSNPWGQTLLTGSLPIDPATRRGVLVFDLAPGLYVLHGQLGDAMLSQKFIVQH